jgi:hypothetical protein
VNGDDDMRRHRLDDVPGHPHRKSSETACANGLVRWRCTRSSSFGCAAVAGAVER